MSKSTLENGAWVMPTRLVQLPLDFALGCLLLAEGYGSTIFQDKAASRADAKSFNAGGIARRWCCAVIDGGGCNGLLLVAVGPESHEAELGDACGG